MNIKNVYPILVDNASCGFVFVALLLRPQTLTIGMVDINTVLKAI